MARMRPHTKGDVNAETYCEFFGHPAGGWTDCGAGCRECTSQLQGYCHADQASCGDLSGERLLRSLFWYLSSCAQSSGRAEVQGRCRDAGSEWLHGCVALQQSKLFE